MASPMQKVSSLVSANLGDTLDNIRNWGNTFYNAPNYGIYPDGTDVTNKLQALVNLANSEGRTAIFFPHGEYYVTYINNDENIYYFGDNAAFTGGYHKIIYQIGSAPTTDLVINVGDFGAKGNGIDDDTTPIQSALYAARDAGGGLVLFPGRNYVITSPLTIYSNTTLMGNGRHYSSLLVTGFTDFALNCSQSNIQIENLGIVTNDVGVKGIASKNVNNLMFSNLYFKGCYVAFDLDGGHTFQISDILIEGHPAIPNAAAKSIFRCTTAGEYIYDVDISSYQIRNIGNGVQTPAVTFHRAVTSYLTRFHVNDLSSGSVGADGILFSDDCQGCKVTSSIIIKPLNYGVEFEQVTIPPSFIDLIGVDVDQSLGDGIRIFQGNWITIQSGVITTCQNHGIVMNYNNNKIQGVTIHGIGQQGVQIGSDVSNFQITNNRIENCSGAAVLVSGGTSNNYIISGNNCAIGNAIKIADNGTGTNKSVTGNI